jgi:serine phosphatase RsbU (regulator of sigma subunit)
MTAVREPSPSLDESSAIPMNGAVQVRDPSHRGRLGARAFLFLVLSATSALPVGLLGMDQAARWAQTQVEITDRQLRATAQASSDQLSMMMQDALHAAESFSDDIAARGNLSDDSLRAAIRAHVAHYPRLLGAYVADEQGMSLMYLSAQGELVPGGVNYGDRDYFKEVARTRRALISQALIGRFTHVLSINVVAPILDHSGRFMGITCSSIDLRGIGERARRAVGGLPEERLVVVDRSGRVLADSAGGVRLEARAISELPLFAPAPIGKAVLRIAPDAQQRSMRSVAMGLATPVEGWRVIAMSPQSAIDDRARQVRNQALAVASVLMALMLVVSAKIADWLARPLRSLAATAFSVSRGEVRALPPPPRTAPREMVQLVQAIGDMINRLGAHAQNLEAEVAERTRDLSRANVELSRALSTILQTEQLIRADIEQARLFQETMLPLIRVQPGLDIATRYLPLERVSGDIFDVYELAKDHLRIFLADATGHGVQASMRTILLKSTYDRMKSSYASPGELMAALNERLITEFPTRELLCAACCIDVRTTAGAARVEYVNAAAEPLRVFSLQGAPREVFSPGPPLAAGRPTWPEPTTFTLARGELLMIASDGLAEQMNESRERFEGHLALFRAERGAESSLERLFVTFEAFRGAAPITDDITVIAIQVP